MGIPLGTHILAEDVLGARHTTKRLISTELWWSLLLSGSIGACSPTSWLATILGQPKPSSRLVEISLPTSRSRTWPPGGQHQPQSHWAPQAESPGASSAVAGPVPKSVLPCRPKCQSCQNNTPQSETAPEAGLKAKKRN